jgi:hypothetical protein
MEAMGFHCDRKKRYASAQEAVYALEHAKKRLTSGRLHAYRCVTCGLFHIGNVTPGQSKGKIRNKAITPSRERSGRQNRLKKKQLREEEE